MKSYRFRLHVSLFFIVTNCVIIEYYQAYLQPFGQQNESWIIILIENLSFIIYGLQQDERQSESA